MKRFSVTHTSTILTSDGKWREGIAPGYVVLCDGRRFSFSDLTKDRELQRKLEWEIGDAHQRPQQTREAAEAVMERIEQCLDGASV